MLSCKTKWQQRNVKVSSPGTITIMLTTITIHWPQRKSLLKNVMSKFVWFLIHRQLFIILKIGLKVIPIILLLFYFFGFCQVDPQQILFAITVIVIGVNEAFEKNRCISKCFVWISDGFSHVYLYVTLKIQNVVWFHFFHSLYWNYFSTFQFLH